MRMTSQDMRNLVDSRIVEVRGVSGVPATVDQAMHAPTCVQVYAMSGLVFDVMYNAKIDQFKLTEVPQ